MAVDEVAALELVDVLLVEAFEEEDVIDFARLEELDTGLLLVLEVTWRTLRPAFDHVAGAQSLDARTWEMRTRKMAREKSLSDGVIVERSFIASATSKRVRERESERMWVSVEGEGVGRDQVERLSVFSRSTR